MRRRIPIDPSSFTEQQIERFWAKVDRRGPEECWLWKGSTTESHGFVYGTCTMGTEHYKPHRVAFALVRGSINAELTLDHVESRGCTSKLCCNPWHMEEVTESENTLRQYRSPDRLYSLTCKKGHAREFVPAPQAYRCGKCAVMAVAKSQAKRADYYRQMKTRQKREQRARKKLTEMHASA